MSKNRTLTGTLTLKVTVDFSGKVVRVDEVESGLTDNRFAQIVMAEARKWNFPKGSNEAAEFTIPLRFLPHHLKPTKVTLREQRLKSQQNRDAARLIYAARSH